ncbi:MAG: hypothetical protein LBI11_05100 [Streptococcaceae bacterium]|jgi:hypothetical protein|nr:hypothetical protein [Streptococcaceae bacterium]
MSKSKKTSLVLAGILIISIVIVLVIVFGHNSATPDQNIVSSSQSSSVSQSSLSSVSSSTADNISPTEPNRYGLSSSAITSALTNIGFSEIQTLPKSNSPLNTFYIGDFSSNNVVKNNSGLDYVIYINYGNDDWRKVTQISHISSVEKWNKITNANLGGLQDGDWILASASHSNAKMITSISQVTDEASKYFVKISN